MVKRLLQTVGLLTAVLVAAGAILTIVFFVFLNQSFTDPPPSAEARCIAPTLYTSANFSDVTSGCQCPVDPLCCPVWKRDQTLSLGLTGFSQTKTCTLGGSSPCITCRGQSDAPAEPESAPTR